MSDCEDTKTGAKIGISIISIIYAIFIFLVISIPYLPSLKEVPQKNTMQLIDTSSLKGRLANIIHKLGNSVNIGMILAIFASGIILGFNTYIMTPLVITMFPVDITPSIQIPGIDAQVSPGQFLIAFLGFVASLILFFVVVEIIHSVDKLIDGNKTIYGYKRSSWVIIIIIFIFLTAMLIWNAIYTYNLLKEPECVNTSLSDISYSIPQGSQKPLGALREGTIKPEKPPFGTF